MKLADFESTDELQKYKIKDMEEGKALVTEISDKMSDLLNDSVDNAKDHSEERYELKKARGLIQAQVNKMFMEKRNA